jgi:hypothetical protein
MTHALTLGQVTIQSISKLEQIGQAKSSASCRSCHEGIGRQHISQIGRKRALCSVTVEIEHAVRAPRLAPLEELVARPAQRMEGMSYSEPATLFLGIGCS